MASGEIKITDKVHTVIAELDLNEKNVINSEFTMQMNEIMDTYEKNTTIRTLIVTATGSFFSNGFDPEKILGVEGSVVEKNVGEAFLLLKRFYRLPFITIAAINGHCMGYGAVWSLFFDFRFMVDSKARFGYPEALIGLALPKSTSLLLKELVGVRVARDLAIFGTGLKPLAAKECGLIDELYPAEELLSKTEKFAAKFVSMSRQGLVGNKLSLKSDISDEVLDKVLTEDFHVSRDMILSKDGQEGLLSIKEGRRPNFG